MLKEQRVEIGKMLDSNELTVGKDIRGIFGQKDEHEWRIMVKQWLIGRDSEILDISFMRRIVINLLDHSGISVKDNFKPSEHYKLCSNAVVYVNKPVQKFYLGYAPTKEKNFPYILFEYSSNKKALKTNVFTYVRAWSAKTKEDMESLMEDLVEVGGL